MKILNFIENHILTIIGFILLGFAIFFVFNNQSTWVVICFLFAIITWQQKDIQDLKQYIYNKKSI